MHWHLNSPRFSLWLMPGGEVRQRLAGAILELSQQYYTPIFEPHVTLAGGIVGPVKKTVSKMRELAGRIAPFTVRLGAVDGSDEYFRCLFVKVATTHLIMSANKAAREVFCLEKQPAFMPHLSLRYGHLPSGVKERMIASLAGRFELEFKATSIHLYLIRREPAVWRRVATTGLGL